ncbi:helix-turn-helix domain-containing protein [Phascolarctobacterium sp.]
MVDKNMKKADLRNVTGISPSSLAKLGKGENVTMDIILKICGAFDCRVEDIMEIIEENKMSPDIGTKESVE